MQNAYLQSMAGPSGGLPYGGLLPGLGMHSSDQGARPWGQKINSNDKLNEWKLFIGQVPLEASLPLHLSREHLRLLIGLLKPVLS